MGCDSIGGGSKAGLSWSQELGAGAGEGSPALAAEAALVDMPSHAAACGSEACWHPHMLIRGRKGRWDAWARWAQLRRRAGWSPPLPRVLCGVSLPQGVIKTAAPVKVPPLSMLKLKVVAPGPTEPPSVPMAAIDRQLHMAAI